MALGAGRALGQGPAARLATGLVALALLVALPVAGSALLGGATVRVELLPWMALGGLRTSWGLLVDSLTGLMLLVVLSISLCVHSYSLGYMAADPHRARFFGYLSLFTFFMLLLVVAPELPQLFVGWEGVGVCSYLLISFWFTRRQAAKAALKAMVVNRVGDLGLLAAMALAYNRLGTLDLGLLLALGPATGLQSAPFLGLEPSLATLLGLLLLVGAVGKSAQLGLHSWLPDAMEGPTPVSALIHAATMVTAGVFLLVRCSPLLALSPAAAAAVALVGSLTALFGATVGLFQNDLKRVVAYSTCSQLGYMTMAVGLGAPAVAAFHLANHAFFKALLFLGSGVVIHAFGDEQDMRRLGGLARLLPLTHSLMVLGSLSLAGFPFLTGFYSKDLILETAAALPGATARFAFWLGAGSAALTAFYSFRLLHLTFWSAPRGPRPAYALAGGGEAPLPMLLPLLFLGLASVGVGFLGRELLVGAGTDRWGSALAAPAAAALAVTEFLPWSVRLLPLALALGGGALSLAAHRLYYGPYVGLLLGRSGRAAVSFLGGRWYLDGLANGLVVRPALAFGYGTTFRLLDRGLLERFGPEGVQRLASAGSAAYVRLHSGLLYHYLFLMVLGLTLPLLSLAGLVGPQPLRAALLWTALALLALPFRGPPSP
jgi:proton-translocating NADH-quinone oxidoreductase chain L